MLTLTLSDISKSFNRRKIFAGISFSLAQFSSITITGKNGSGKSTLLKIIAGILSASSGSVIIAEEGREVRGSDHYRYFGFVSPYLQLYDEFSGVENLQLLQDIRGMKCTRHDIDQFLGAVGLAGRGDDLVRAYSSGMKQRLKYAAALIHSPKILLLDEPTSNLDEEGKGIVHEIIARQKEKGIVVLATNEKDELNLSQEILRLGEGSQTGSTK